MKMFWQEMHTYSMETEEYEKFLNDYCSTYEDPQEATTEIAMRDAYVDWITGKGKCEIEEDDGNWDELQQVFGDIRERIDANGYYAEKRELEEELAKAIKKVDSIRDALIELQRHKGG